MASGFFLGGAAEGQQNAIDTALKRDTLAQELALKTRGLDQSSRGLDLQEKQIGQTGSLQSRALDLQEMQIKNQASRELLTRADGQIDQTMSVVSETIKAGLAAGKNPVEINKAVAPLVASAKSLAQKAGRDPQALDNRVIAELTLPTGTEAATATGAASAAKTIAEQKALTQVGMDDSTIYKTPKDKQEAENSLRDDFVKASKDFQVIRDAKNRIDSISPEGSGASDVALVFQYMKILDPGSTVREGEFATASQAAGVPSHILGLYNKAVGGGLLATKARTEIRTEAEKLYSSQESQHKRLAQTYKDIATRRKLNVDNVVIDMSPNPKPKGAGATGSSIPPPPKGFNLVSP